MMINRYRKAVTLLEVSIGIIISALLLAAILHLFSSGMKGSTKGLAHQANMEAATIIMSQIEYDLLKSTEILDPDKNTKGNIARWKFYYEPAGGVPVTVKYSANATDGVTRSVDLGNGKKQNTVLGKGHKIELNFIYFQATSAPSEYYDLGKKYQRKNVMWVEIKVSTKNDKKIGENEHIELKRLIVVRSQQ